MGSYKSSSLLDRVMDYLSFTCMHCESRLKIPPQFAGKVVACPKCRNRTEVPETEEGNASYGVAGESNFTPDSTAANTRSWAEVWRALGYDGLSAKSRGRLEEARALARREEWQEAVSLLNELFQASAKTEMTRENAVFRLPLSYCLTHWALEDLEADPDPRLSRPMRQLLKVAGEKQKWGGVFDMNECGLCRGSLKSIRGRPSVRTTVGTAYLCCARPDQHDQQLAREANAIWQRLCLATVLDDQNDEAWQAMKKLPAWQAVLRVSELKLSRGSLAEEWDVETDEVLGVLSELLVEGLIDGLSGGFG